MTSTLVVAPHPDDEVLGACSALCHSSVTVVHVTDGVPPWIDSGQRPSLRSLRQAECSRAWTALGADVSHVQLGHGDLRAWRAVLEIADSLYQLVQTTQPGRVLLPAYQRGHPDHDATYLAGALASERNTDHATEWMVYALYGLDSKRTLRFGWLPQAAYSSIETRSDPTVLEAKQRALSAFSSQLRPGSVVQEWLDDPSVEQAARLPRNWRESPDVPCFYDEVLDFGRYGAGSLAVESSFREVLAGGRG
jgi:LmbE family N-acetylglucosaminyl deacetylase